MLWTVQWTAFHGLFSERVVHELTNAVSTFSFIMSKKTYLNCGSTSS